MSAEERTANVCEAPGAIPDGSETLTAKLCAENGIYKDLKEKAFYLPSQTGEDSGRWRDVELRVVWCDRSVWAMVLASRGVEDELAEAARTGRETRKISLVRLRGANHFVSAGRGDASAHGSDHACLL